MAQHNRNALYAIDGVCSGLLGAPLTLRADPHPTRPNPGALGAPGLRHEERNLFLDYFSVWDTVSEKGQ
jgi:hypothetical protein